MTIPILAAIFWVLGHPASSIAQIPPTTWTEFDHKDMVLLDISPGPASYVAAFVAGPNGGGLHREAIIMCDSILADLPPESACDCDLINGDDCMAYNKRGELSDGRIKAGKKIWYPRPTNTGNTNAASDADPGRGD